MSKPLFGQITKYELAAPDVQFEGTADQANQERVAALDAANSLWQKISKIKSHPDYEKYMGQLGPKVDELQSELDGMTQDFALTPTTDETGNQTGYDFKAPDWGAANREIAGKMVQGLAAPFLDAASAVGNTFADQYKNATGGGTNLAPQNFGTQALNFGKAAFGTANNLVFEPVGRFFTHPREASIAIGENLQQGIESVPQSLYNMYAEYNNVANNYHTTDYMTKFGLGDLGDATANYLMTNLGRSTPQDMRSYQNYSAAQNTDERRAVANEILHKQGLVKATGDLLPFIAGAGAVGKGLDAVKGLELVAGTVKSQLPKLATRALAQGAVQGGIGYVAANPQHGTTDQRIQERANMAGYAGALTAPLELGSDALKVLSLNKKVPNLSLGKPKEVNKPNLSALKDFEATQNTKLIEDLKTGELPSMQAEAEAVSKVKKRVRKAAAKKPTKDAAKAVTDKLDAARKDGIEIPKTTAEETLERTADKPMAPDEVGKREMVDAVDEPVGGNNPKATPAQNDNTLIQQQKQNAKFKEEKAVEAAYGADEETAKRVVKESDPEDRITIVDMWSSKIGFIPKLAKDNMGAAWRGFWGKVAEAANSKISTIKSSNKFANEMSAKWRTKWGEAAVESVNNGRYRRWAEGGLGPTELKGNEAKAFSQLKAVYRAYNKKILKPLLSGTGVDITKVDPDYFTQASTGKYEFTMELNKQEADALKKSGLTVFQDFDIDPMTKQPIPKDRWLAVMGYGDSVADIVKKLKDGKEYYSWRFPQLFNNGELNMGLFQSKNGLSKIRQQTNDFKMLINGEDVGKLNEISAARIKENLIAKGYSKTDANKIIQAATDGNWSSVSSDKKLYSAFVGSLQGKKGEMAKIVGNVNPIEAGRQQAIHLAKKVERDTVVNMVRNARTRVTNQIKDLGETKATSNGLADQAAATAGDWKQRKLEYTLEVLKQEEERVRGVPTALDKGLQYLAETTLERANQTLYKLTGRTGVIPTEKAFRVANKLHSNAVALFATTKLMLNAPAGAINYAQATMQALSIAQRDGNVGAMISGGVDDFVQQLAGIKRDPMGLFKGKGFFDTLDRMRNDKWYGELYVDLIGYDPHLDSAFSNQRAGIVNKGGRLVTNTLMAPYSLLTHGGTMQAFAMGEWIAKSRGLVPGTKEFADEVYRYVSNAGLIRVEQATRLTGDSTFRNLASLQSFVLSMAHWQADAVAQTVGNPKLGRNWLYLSTAAGGPALLAGAYGSPIAQVPLQMYNGLAGLYNANNEGMDLPSLSIDSLKVQAANAKDSAVKVNANDKMSLTDKALANFNAGVWGVAAGGIPYLFGVDVSNLQIDTGRMLGSNVLQGGAIGSISLPGMQYLSEIRNATLAAGHAAEMNPKDPDAYWRVFGDYMKDKTDEFMRSQVTAYNRARTTEDIIKTGKVINRNSEVTYTVPKGQVAASATLHSLGFNTVDEATEKSTAAVAREQIDAAKKETNGPERAAAKAYMDGNKQLGDAVVETIRKSSGKSVEQVLQSVASERKKMETSKMDRLRSDTFGNPNSATSLLMQMKHPDSFSQIWPQYLIDISNKEEAAAMAEVEAARQQEIDAAKAEGRLQGQNEIMDTMPIQDDTIQTDSAEVQQ